MSEVRIIPAPSDGSEAYLSDVRKLGTHEERFSALRAILNGRPMACPDCRALKNAMVILMDTLTVEPGAVSPSQLPSATQETVVTHYANSDVSMTGNPVPTPGAGVQGREVAPGVVIIDAVKDTPENPPGRRLPPPPVIDLP